MAARDLLDKGSLRLRLSSLIEGLTYAEKWLVLGILVGLASGLFVLGFFMGLHKVVEMVAYFIGERNVEISPLEADLSTAVVKGGFDPVRFYLVLLAGAAISSLIVYTFAPEAEGHGTDAAVAAFHRRAAIIPFKVPIVKAVASAIAIGSGNSGGVEGPSVQMGAGIGSTIGRLLHLTLSDRRIVLTAGIAGALSAMFRAPIGSSFFAVEVLYKRDMEVQAFMPSIISSIVSFAVTAPYFKYGTMLPTIPINNAVLYKPTTILLLLGLGAFTAPFSWLYVKTFKFFKQKFDWLVEEKGLNIYLKPILGTLIGGIIIILWPLTSGSGRGVLKLSLEGKIVNYVPLRDVLPLWLALIIAAVMKIIATSLTIGSGISGGVYAPGLFAGSLVGLAYYQIVKPYASDLGLTPHLFAYIGMATFFGAAAKVPLATSVMVGEMGGDYLLIAPTLIAAFIARELVGDDSIYESQIPRRLHEEAVTAESILVMLKDSGEKPDVKASEIIDTSYKPISIRATLREAIALMMQERGRIIPVVDENGRVEGVLDPEDLEEILEERGEDLDIPLSQVKLRIPPIVSADANLETVLETMVEHATDYVIVVDADGKYMGVVTIDDVSAAIAYILARHYCYKKGAGSRGVRCDMDRIPKQALP